MLQVRTDRDHVHIRIGFLNDTAFQTGMHNLSLRLLSVQIQISLLHDFQDRRIDIRLPSAVTIRIFHLRPGQRENTFQTRTNSFLAALGRTANQNLNLDHFVRGLDDCQVCRRFDRTRKIDQHTDHTVLATFYRIDQIILNLFRNQSCRHIGHFFFVEIRFSHG